jgi:hypothetical protein
MYGYALLESQEGGMVKSESFNATPPLSIISNFFSMQLEIEVVAGIVPTLFTLPPSMMTAMSSHTSSCPRSASYCSRFSLLLLEIHARRILCLGEYPRRVLDHVPGLRLQRLGAELGAAVDLVVIVDHTLDPLPRLQNPLNVRDTMHGDLGDVQQARHATRLDIDTVRLEGLDHPLDDVSMA